MIGTRSAILLLLLPAPALLAAGCASGPSVPDGKVLRNRGTLTRLEEPTPARAAPDGAPPAPVPPDAHRLTIFPEGPLLYDPYLAAQRQSRADVKVVFPAGDGSHRRIENTLGLQRSLLRWTREDSPASGTELQFEAAVFARFDLAEHYDMAATDWRFGLPLVFRDGDLAWKIHLSHLTSHLGDEYMERTGAEAVSYHLEEAALGLSWDAGPGTRVYGEAAAALYVHEPAKNGRVQAGAEWVGHKGPSGLAPYFAVDITARHEQDWTPGATVAVGVAFGRSFRFGAEYFHGRDPQTQFLKERVSFIAIGLAFDY